MNQYDPSKLLSAQELSEVDRKVAEEVKRINLLDWAVKLMSIGMLWALWERLGKPITKNLSTIADANVSYDHAYGRRAPGGALARVENIEDILPFGKNQRRALQLALAQAGEHIQGLSDQAKNAVRLHLIRAKIEGTHPRLLAARLRETFKGLDRDWRRIAITESAAIATHGYLMSQGEGQQVVGQSAVDCCPWCRDMIHGKVFTVTHQAPSGMPDPEWDTHIWPGKTNVGRVRHARQKGGRVRISSELWKPTIPLHPHCRCRWVAFNPKFHEVDKQGFMRPK